MTSCCCKTSQPRSNTRLKKFREICAWVLPNAILVLMPKCPLCLAAYLAVGAGIGLSLRTATDLRWAMLLLCIASLSYLIVTRFHRFAARRVQARATP